MTSNNLENISSELIHQEAVSVDGFEDIFSWAQSLVADGEEPRAKRAREQKIRRRVLELVQSVRDQKQKEQVKDEINYLQRRVIALLQLLQEATQENSSLKQAVVAQQLTLIRLPELEDEVKRLRSADIRREEAEQAQKELIGVLAKVKKDRDFLEELVIANEQENSRLAYLFRETKDKLEVLLNRRWWHWFLPRR